MKNRKLLFGLVALVGFGLFFTLNAFKDAKRGTDVAYQYTLDTSDGVKISGNWTPITYVSNPTECESEGELACIVQFNTDDYANISAFLSAHADADAVNNSMYTKRHKEPVQP